MGTCIFWEIPIVLGPTGTIAVGIIIFIQAILNAYSWRKSNQAANLKGAVDAMEKELNIYRSRTERLDGEVKELQKNEEDCQRKLDRVTRWYLEAKGEEEDMDRENRRRPGAGL